MTTRSAMRSALLGAAASLLAACASTDFSDDPSPLDQHTDVQAFLRSCRGHFDAVDATVDRANVREAGFPSIPGFPYLRNSRLMASFAHEAVVDKNVFQAWTLEMRDNDAYAREAEFKDLGKEAVERTRLSRNLRYCAVWLCNLELEQKDKLDLLVQTASKVPDERNWPDPIARLRWSADKISADEAKRHQDMAADFAVPIDQLTSPGPVTLWMVAPKTDPDDIPSDLDSFRHDEMGRIGLTPAKWAALAEKYAPRLAVEEGGPFDLVGTPRWTPGGPVLDPAQPIVFYLPAYARAGKAILVQFNYFIFFSAHASKDNDQRDNGTLDGLIWRVTLDPSGKPVLYDTIHMSGFDETWFPLPPLTAKAAGGAAAQVPFVPQAQIPAGEFLVRLKSGSHDVRRLLLAGDLPPAKTQRYELRPYEELFQEPVDETHSHNLFNPEGVIEGTERKGGAFYHALGFANAGMLREWGKHPTSFTGNSYFDDPFLIQSNFNLPDWPSAKRYQQDAPG